MESIEFLASGRSDTLFAISMVIFLFFAGFFTPFTKIISKRKDEYRTTQKYARITGYIMMGYGVTTLLW